MVKNMMFEKGDREFSVVIREIYDVIAALYSSISALIQFKLSAKIEILR